MQLKVAALALACLAEQVYNVEAKSFLASRTEGSLRRSDEMEINYHRLHKRMAEPQQPSMPAASVSTSPTATSAASAAASSAPVGNATAECEKSLSSLNGVSKSPTGMSLCYDVTSLDNASGKFTSNIFLYQVAPASGNWTVIDPTSLNVDIAYNGVNLTAMGISKRDLVARLATNTPTDAPVLITSQQFMGQVMNGWDPNNVTAQMTVLSPSVIVTAKTPSGQPLNSTLPKTEAAFITGFFNKQATANAAAASASATNTPFVLPGVAPAFFPIGSIVTGAWLLLFLLAVGGGALGKLQMRHDYRSRARTAGNASWRPAGPNGTGGVAAYDRR